jgi:hypothetical protein
LQDRQQDVLGADEFLPERACLVLGLIQHFAGVVGQGLMHGHGGVSLRDRARTANVAKVAKVARARDICEGSMISEPGRQRDKSRTLERMMVVAATDTSYPNLCRQAGGRE